ncbi:cupin domain-containing protein [Paenibacillus sp. SYP-B3998]|uniref:Cupin domain-containing protein n=1 Tax=Paenibacillus sp. SYP-B3998 TaxID=2678564 RepID=A0A6G4A3T8_9BACL|nr:cupin domain-containing protein [Paenibacillus sp. SYP-B3998]NEW09052.1 cupin domain-containing protein [Paenibacillus sp. SYP-B3998]
MIIVNANTVKPDDRPQVFLKTLFTEESIAGGKVKFGTIVIPPKARVPLNGEGAHDQDEYSIVIKGAIETGSGGKEYLISAGDATLIPAGEAHWAYNSGDVDCEIVWVLVER